MNDTPEKRVQNKIFMWLVESGALVIRVNSGAISHSSPGKRKRFIRFVMWRALGTVLSSAGVSDLIACLNGQFVAIECKAPGKLNNVSPAQHKFLTMVNQAGGLGVVADDLQIVKERLLNESGIITP